MADKPRLVLHVGGHKTGTSSLQRFVRERREDVLSRGVHVPAFGPGPPGEEQGHVQFFRHVASARARSCGPASGTRTGRA